MTTRGFTLSLDQLMSIEEQKQKEVIDPLKKIAALMELGLQHILGKLGVDCACEEREMHTQLQEFGIHIQERNETTKPKANGFYVFQGKTALTMEPVAFISSPYIDNLGKANITIELYRNDIQFEMGGIKIPVY
jgi:hypothetical protein